MGNSHSHINAHLRVYTHTHTHTPRIITITLAHIRVETRTHVGIRKLVVRFHPDPTNQPTTTPSNHRPLTVRTLCGVQGVRKRRGAEASAGAVEGRQATLLTRWPPGVNVGWLAASKWGYRGVAGGREGGTGVG